MVYNLKKQTGKRRERKEIEGKLIGIQTDQDKCKVYDEKLGKYSWLRLSLVVGKDKFFNLTLFDVDLSTTPELKRADELLSMKKHPLVRLRYYSSETEAKDKEGNPIFVDEEIVKDGKNYIKQVPKKWVNNRANNEDINEGFKILEENVVSEESKFFQEGNYTEEKV